MDSIRESVLYDLRRYLNIRSVSSPKFSPDGEQIAFISNITGLPQIWVVSSEPNAALNSLELFSVENERIGFIDFAFAEDMLIYGVDKGGNERYQLRIIKDGGASLQKLTDHPEVIHNWGSFSKDGKKVVYSSNLRDQRFFDVYIQDTNGETNSGELVFRNDGTNLDMKWSPNDEQVMIKTVHSPFDHELSLLDLKTKSVGRILPHEGAAIFDHASFDASGNSLYCVSNVGRDFAAIARIDLVNHHVHYLYEEPACDAELLALSPNNKKLAFTMNRDGYSELYCLDLSRGSGSTVERIPAREGVIADQSTGALEINWSPDSKRLAFSLSTASVNSDIWVYDFRTSKLSQVTKVSTSGIPQSSFGNAKVVKFPSFDNLEVSSFVFMPNSTHNTETKVPLIMYLHGGPESQFRPSFSPLIQYFVHLGYAVGVPNFRGSTGYGRKFTHMDDVYNRMDTVRDVVSFLSYLKSSPNYSKQIDFERVAAFGGSYGGFMVLACLYANPELWAAGVDIVGIANFITFLRNTGPWRRKLRIAEYGDPDKDAEFLARISPVNNAEKITAPLFIIHGKNDPRVPLGEAEQISETMKKLGREVHLLKFEGEGHGLHKISDRIVGYSAALEFLIDHLSTSQY
jgi:dipeptidyl aminopeptidase/acylaminoacyl peptidase